MPCHTAVLVVWVTTLEIVATVGKTILILHADYRATQKGAKKKKKKPNASILHANTMGRESIKIPQRYLTLSGTSW